VFGRRTSDDGLRPAPAYVAAPRGQPTLVEGRSAVAEYERSSDPRVHARNIRSELDEVVQHLRRDAGRVDDPRGQALFETAAEVLVGLEKALTDFEQRNEPAWQA
jgi:hypothetical protein